MLETEKNTDPSGVPCDFFSKFLIGFRHGMFSKLKRPGPGFGGYSQSHVSLSSDRFHGRQSSYHIDARGHWFSTHTAWGRRWSGHSYKLYYCTQCTWKRGGQKKAKKLRAYSINGPLESDKDYPIYSIGILPKGRKFFAWKEKYNTNKEKYSTNKNKVSTK